MISTKRNWYQNFVFFAFWYGRRRGKQKSPGDKIPEISYIWKQKFLPKKFMNVKMNSFGRELVNSEKLVHEFVNWEVTVGASYSFVKFIYDFDIEIRFVKKTVENCCSRKSSRWQKNEVMKKNANSKTFCFSETNAINDFR